MRKLTIITIAIIVAFSLLTFSACYAYEGPPYKGESNPPSLGPGSASPDAATELGICENPPITTSEQDTINFSIDINTANYMLFKNMVLDSQYYAYIQDLAKLAQANQMLNYFDYDYAQPENGELLALTASLFDNPFNSDSKLLSIGLKAKEQQLDYTANNIVVLLDVSGSMNSSDKLGMAKKSIITMAENFSSSDKISLVTYAGTANVVLDGIDASEYSAIENAVSSLSASGSTNGEGGLDLAYHTALKNFIEDGNNRIILMSDGDFNVGKRSQQELKDYISEQRDKGIYLSCIGFGNIYDYSLVTMETLSKHGNGNWGYIRNEQDIYKLLVDEIDSTLVTIAKDVKANIKFNPDTVKSYRLIGYENNLLSDEEYEADETDAGEIGSGFELTICFEIVLNDDVDLALNTENFAQINLKYKQPDETATDPSSELTLPVEANCYKSQLDENDIFVSSVIEFALIAIESKYMGQASIEHVIASLENLNLSDRYKLEFLEVVKAYEFFLR